MKKKINTFLFFFVFLPQIFLGQTTDTLRLNSTYRLLPFGLKTTIPAELNDFAIVLSGGGARGFAEIGILKALEESHIPFTRIYGTSIGAIIGGLYSLGYSINQISKIVLSTNWNSFYNLEEKNRSQLFLEQKRILDNAFLTLRINGFQPVIPKSINSGFLINNFFTKLKLNAPLNRIENFDKLRFKFRAVASDLFRAKSVLLKKGDIAKAFRASSSVTFLMPPVKIDSMTLVDGGIIANIPVRVAIDDGSKFVIAIDVTSPLRKENEIKYPWEIADQLVSLPMQEINNINRLYADFVIRPNLARKSYDFTNIKKLININLSVKKIIPKLKKKIENFIENQNPILSEEIKNFTIHPTDSIANELKNALSFTNKLTKAKLYFELYILKKKYALKDIFAIIKKDKNNKSEIILHYSEYPLIKNIEIYSSELSQKNKREINSSFSEKLNLSPENIENIILTILGEIRKEGNFSTTFSHYIFTKKDSTLKLFFLNPSIKKIEIKGNNKSEDFVIRRELSFSKGKYLTKKGSDKSLKNLRISDLFKSVQINLKKINNLSDKIVINVEEKPTKLVRFGLKSDNEFLSRIFVDIRNENLFGGGNQIGFSFFGGINSQEIIFEHIAPRIFSSYFTYKIQLKYNHILIPKFKYETTNFLQTEEKFKYDQSESAIILGLGRQIPRLGNLLAIWKYSRFKIWNYPGYKEDLIINSLKLNFTIDSRQDAYFGKKGILLNAYYEFATHTFGSKISYNKTFLYFKKFISVTNEFVISPELKIGYINRVVPLSQRFQLGGQFDFFGMNIFQYNGGQIFKTSLGLRYKFPFKIFFPAFLEGRYDFGRIWEKKESIKLGDLVHAIGISLSFKTPIGPAVFSVGRSFYFKNIIPKEIINLSDFHFYFSLGYYFDIY